MNKCWFRYNEKGYRIVPSILAADGARLGEEAKAVLEAGSDWIHVDVMDNHYVKNLSFGPHICYDLRKFGINVPIDVHLAVKPVDNLISVFANSGVNMITFHPEGTKDLNRSINLIHSFGLKAGLAFNPGTSLASLKFLECEIDFILIMSVRPGFGGQKFIPSVLDKIKKARLWIQRNGKFVRLGVDGGINQKNIKKIANAGADTFVIGTSIFKSKNYKETIKKMRGKL